MVGKTTPKQLITSDEAIALFEYANIDEMYIVKALEETYRAHERKSYADLWDMMRLLSFIYDTGRIQGMREERAKKKSNRG